MLHKTPYILFCQSCKWQSEGLIKGDVIFSSSSCPQCQNGLTLKPISDLSLVERAYLKAVDLLK